MTSTEIFIEFERMAIAWGKKHQIAKVGEIVTSNIGKRNAKFQISQVSVTIGRNAKKTVKKTFVMQYVGRKINSKGLLVQEIGTGRLLFNFTKDNGVVFDHSENEVTTWENDGGLSFVIDYDPEVKIMYPNACDSYKDPYHDFRYTR